MFQEGNSSDQIPCYTASCKYQNTTARTSSRNDQNLNIIHSQDDAHHNQGVTYSER